MNARRLSLWVALLLALLGVSGALWRAHLRQQVRLAHGDSLWRLRYTVDFYADKRGARLHLASPLDTAQSRVFRQEMYHRGLIPARHMAGERTQREIDLVADREGALRVTAQFDIHVSPESRWRAWGALDAAPALTNGGGAAAALVDSTLAELRTRAAVSNLVTTLYNFCADEIVEGAEDEPGDADMVLAHKSAPPGGKARALVALCRAAHIPARLVTGFELEPDDACRPIVWTEILRDKKWQPYDPERGLAGALPPSFVPVRRDATELAWGASVRDVKTTFSVEALPPPPGVLATGRRTVWEILDLTRLPLEAHQVMALILLIPLGALVTALFRTVVGLGTFGTFTPTLLALSFVYADWHTGLFVFAVVMVLGLTSRSLIERLKLLVVPRLSVILTLVVLCLAFCISLLDYAHLTPTPQAVLLPMVILTMTIERFFINMEEDGMRNAFQRFLLTLLVACCCYLVLRWNTVGHFLLTYPEIHLVTIAVLILIGRYTGYRLTELWRFRDLTVPPLNRAGPS
jgi:transglutaminase-like putative cysteine protease